MCCVEPRKDLYCFYRRDFETLFYSNISTRLLLMRTALHQKTMLTGPSLKWTVYQNENGARYQFWLSFEFVLFVICFGSWTGHVTGPLGDCMCGQWQFLVTLLRKQYMCDPPQLDIYKDTVGTSNCSTHARFKITNINGMKAFHHQHHMFCSATFS